MHDQPVKPTFEEFHRRLSDVCDPYVEKQLRALRLWSPDFIALASPLIVCALIGPAAVHAPKRTQKDGATTQKASQLLEREILSIVLQRFANYWPLGNVICGEFCCHTKGDSEMPTPMCLDVLKYVQSKESQNLDGRIETTWIRGLTPVTLQGRL